jgi:putative transcriptional regulator
LNPRTRRFFSTQAFLAFLLAACFAAASYQARALDSGKPLMLVASPVLEGPYRHTTVVVVPVDGKHVGFILNRATDVKLSALFPDHPASAKVTTPLHIGGPEMLQSLFVVVRRDPGGQSLQLTDDLYVTGKAETINRIMEQTPNDARYFVGFVGWAAGELDDEIDRGLWFVTEADTGIVFRSDTKGMWEELVKRLGNNPRPVGRGFLQAKLVN